MACAWLKLQTISHPYSYASTVNAMYHSVVVQLYQLSFESQYQGTYYYVFILVAPLDYGAVAMDIEFQPGAEEQQSIDILIIDDVFNERTEFFTARLEVPSAETGVILGSINMSSITIIDNDRK